MPASFKVIQDPIREEVLQADFGGSAIGRVALVTVICLSLRCARQLLKPEHDGKELIERIDKQITALSYHMQNYYWLDFITQLNNIYRYKTEEYSHTAVNKFNVISESIPDSVFEFMPLRGGYFIGNVSPARMDFKLFLFGNCIAILSSLATPAQATTVMDLIEERWTDLIGEMPLKITYPALEEGHEWQNVTGCDPKNTRSYHNGGSWPVLLWLLTAASIKTGRPQIAKRAIELGRPASLGNKEMMNKRQKVEGCSSISSSTIFDISQDSLIDVFCRLSMKEVRELRGVHPWFRQAIAARDFSLDFSDREATAIAFSEVDNLGTRYRIFEVDNSLFLQEHRAHYGPVICSFEEDNESMPITGSVEGFLLMSGEFFVVQNPVTGERVSIPYPDDYIDGLTTTVGFGKSVGGRFKLLLITQEQDGKDVQSTHCQVYRVGFDEGWVNIDISDDLLYSPEERINFLNGSHHWLAHEPASGAALLSVVNLETETFSTFSVNVPINIATTTLSVLNNMDDHNYLHAVRKFDDGDLLLLWSDFHIMYQSMRDGFGEVDGIFPERIPEISHRSAVSHILTFDRLV